MNAKANELLVQVTDRERAEKDPQYNIDNPESCDLCGTSFLFQKFLIDGEVKDTDQVPLSNGQSMGEWGYMCSECFVKKGVAIQWGRGQLYEKTSEDEWLLVGGFPPEEQEFPED